MIGSKGDPKTELIYGAIVFAFIIACFSSIAWNTYRKRPKD
jgi:hypothetical protein